MKVLVLGGAGYIGSVLCDLLKEKGDEPMVYDNFLYEKTLWRIKRTHTIEADIRDINRLSPAIEQADAVVNLAAISNDPASDLQPRLTWEINYKANELIAQLLQVTGKRVIFASSCSMYGSSLDVRDEESPVTPLTLYARTKMLSEPYYLHKDVDGIVLRFATVYGYSPKPRFDLVVNTMIGSSYFLNTIVVHGGDQMRPVVHVKDVAMCIYLALHKKNNKFRVYNVGSNKQNYQMYALGKLLHEKLTEVKFEVDNSIKDKRNYNVSFNRLYDLGFDTTHTVGDAIDEFYGKFVDKSIKTMDEDVYYRVKYLKKHL